MKSLGQKASEIAKGEPVFVDKYEELLEKIAEISYDNPNYILYYRGQSKDHLNQANATTIYPSIYRGHLNADEIKSRFRLLKMSCDELINSSRDHGIKGIDDIERRRLIQWSIIQHYEICDTPLLDVTHSLRVACTFAVQNETDHEIGYVYVLAMPYLTNRITINSEEDMLLVRLLSISPPDAKRPYFQEGYLAGTTDITDKYGKKKDELDFNLRLVGKFAFKNTKKFWGSNFTKLKEEFIYPPNDRFCEVAEHVRNKRKQGFYSSDIGEFLLLWNELETRIRNSMPDREYLSMTNAIEKYVNTHSKYNISINEVDNIRRFRNRLVHDTKEIEKHQIEKYYTKLRHFIDRL